MSIPKLPIEERIAKFLDGKPALKALFIILTSMLGVARARGWFVRRYGI